ncbi:hypothetical protein DSC45_30780 [Streptomyces sp. YIM 130001]|nr:hypothetical protein DSC45_30780 [Streptomyces sp. YIM 130001]
MGVFAWFTRKSANADATSVPEHGSAGDCGWDEAGRGRVSSGRPLRGGRTAPLPAASMFRAPRQQAVEAAAGNETGDNIHR